MQDSVLYVIPMQKGKSIMRIHISDADMEVDHSKQYSSAIKGIIIIFIT